jgi:hypothetical protein
VDPAGTVESIQAVRLPGPPPDLRAVERAYFRWVPAVSAGFAAPRWSADPDGPLRIAVQPLGLPLIRMTAAAGDPRRRRGRTIMGGLLAWPGGELSFEVEPAGAATLLRVALRGFRPRMPAWLYWSVQRPLHERSSLAFLRLAASARGARPRLRGP